MKKAYLFGLLIGLSSCTSYRWQHSPAETKRVTQGVISDIYLTKAKDTVYTWAKVGYFLILVNPTDTTIAKGKFKVFGLKKLGAK